MPPPDVLLHAKSDRAISIRHSRLFWSLCFVACIKHATKHKLHIGTEHLENHSHDGDQGCDQRNLPAAP